MRDSLWNSEVRRILNLNRWDEARYLIILYACTINPAYRLQGRKFDGHLAFLRKILDDFAKSFPPPRLSFEFFKGAAKMLEDRLETDFGYVKTFRDEKNYTYYALTAEGEKTARSALTEATKSIGAAETMSLPTSLLQMVMDQIRRIEEEKGVSNHTKELREEYEKFEPMRLVKGTRFDEAKVVKLTKAATRIGRSTDNTLSFPDDRYMSRVHAEISWDGAAYWISDLSSKNGTWRIDQKGSRVRVSKEKLTKDTYEMGTTRLRFQSG